MGASITPLPLRKKLSDFIHDTSFEKLQPNIVHHAKLCLLDLIGVSLAGGCQKAALPIVLFPLHDRRVTPCSRCRVIGS
jgi:2-methylcitrate dehydratase PrpD